MKPSHLLTLAAALCLALTSCVPTSESPLSSVKDAHIDPALVGNWLDKNDQETYRITQGEGSWMHVDILKAGAKTDSYDFYPTQIGNDSFANVILLGKNDKTGKIAKTYTFIRYTVTPLHKLKMWSMSSEVMAAAVHAGKLKGTVTEDKNPDVNLTGDSATLVKFIQNSDLTKLFTNEATLVQIELTEK